jgi:hypothetical protein
MHLSLCLTKAVDAFNEMMASDGSVGGFDEAILDTYQSVIEFGPDVGIVTMKQLTAEAYNTKCLSVNSKTSDNTGFRVYAGNHIALRAIGRLKVDYDLKYGSNPPLPPEQSGQVEPAEVRVLELGCGCGALSAIVSHMDVIRVLLDQPPVPTARTSYVVTDGNKEALEIARYNFCRYGNSAVQSAFQQFLWRDTAAETLGTSDNFDMLDQQLRVSSVAAGVAGSAASRVPFDLVLGSELFYYKVDVIALLTDVLILLGALPNRKSANVDQSTGEFTSELEATPFVARSRGMFFHTHVFRGLNNQEQQVINFLAQFGWSTAEIPLSAFLSEECKVMASASYRCLVSASNEVVEELLKAHPQWIRFVAYEDGEDPELEKADGDGDNDFLYR